MDHIKSIRSKLAQGSATVPAYLEAKGLDEDYNDIMAGLRPDRQRYVDVALNVILGIPQEQPTNWRAVPFIARGLLTLVAKNMVEATFDHLEDCPDALLEALELRHQEALVEFTYNVKPNMLMNAQYECYHENKPWPRTWQICLAFCADPNQSIEGWETYGPKTLALFDQLIYPETTNK